jgi:hypothetical protein
MNVERPSENRRRADLSESESIGVRRCPADRSQFGSEFVSRLLGTLLPSDLSYSQYDIALSFEIMRLQSCPILSITRHAGGRHTLDLLAL